MPARLTFTREIAATPEHLYFAFTTGMGLKEWFAHAADASMEKYNFFHLYWDDGAQASGQFHDLEENHSLRWSWQGYGDPAPTEVRIRITAGAEHSTVTVEHQLPAHDGPWQPVAETLTRRWERGLDNLKTVMETGFDPRMYQQPMLGIFIGDFVSAEMAERKGWSFDYGHKITGVIPNMGAEAAGLQKGDVILHIDGAKIRSYAALDRVIQAHRSGDIVDLEYLRDGKLHAVQMQFSSRPQPDVPSNSQALSETMSSFYRSANAQLRELIDDVTEEEAEYRPAPAEWNTKDVFAHLILSEREMYTWVAAQALSKHRMAYTSNSAVHLKAVRTQHADLPALFGGLQAAQREGVALLSELPAEFATRKSSFVPLAAELVEGVPHHYKDHIGQINDALTAARALG